MSDSENTSDDLTNLSIRPESTKETAARVQSAAEIDAAAFSITLDAGGENHLEGLDDLLSPLSPTLSGIEESTPLTAEVETPVLPAAETPIGATIAAKLSTPMEEVREYSDHIAPAAGPSIASTPYSVLIEGALKTHEREALLQILSRENLGIREVELEPQFDAGRILIPRVSEYVGVMIVQTLRGAAVRMRLGPSERIYVADGADDGDRLIFHPSAESELLITEEGNHPADLIILSPDSEIQGKNIIEALDTLHSSMNLRAAQIAQPQSPVFQEAMEKLKRQLKFQAHHRGAHALLSFKYELHPLEGQTVYKLVVQAKAVRFT